MSLRVRGVRFTSIWHVTERTTADGIGYRHDDVEHHALMWARPQRPSLVKEK